MTLPDGSVRELTPGATGRLERLVRGDAASWASTAWRRSAAARHRRASGRCRDARGRSPGRVGRAARAAGPRTRPTGSRWTCSRSPRSAIAPGDGVRLAALGTDAGERPGAAAASPATSGGRRSWRSILLILLAEWALYERDGARRIWAGDPRRRAPARRCPAAGQR